MIAKWNDTYVHTYRVHYHSMCIYIHTTTTTSLLVMLVYGIYYIYATAYQRRIYSVHTYTFIYLTGMTFIRASKKLVLSAAPAARQLEKKAVTCTPAIDTVEQRHVADACSGHMTLVMGRLHCK